MNLISLNSHFIAFIFVQVAEFRSDNQLLADRLYQSPSDKQTRTVQPTLPSTQPSTCEQFPSLIFQAPPLPSQPQTSCSCKSMCATKKCPCKAAGVSCATYCHPQKVCSNITRKTGVKQAVIDLTDPTQFGGQNKSSLVWMKVGQTTLYEADKDTIANGNWLSDSHIHAAQELLTKNHPNISGLQDPILQMTKTFAVQGYCEFVQCLNLGSSHWITVSTVGCSQDIVKIYDSMSLRLSSSIIETIASLLHTKSKAFTLEYLKVQQQLWYIRLWVVCLS